jgi:hypothetical protein
MKTQTGSKDLKFVPHSSNYNDSMDVPFRIVGHKLRWIAARASEDKFTRPWKVLKKSDLPANVVQDLESRSVNIFRDGETVRFGENVLAYAPDEIVEIQRQRVAEETESQLASIGQDSDKRSGVRISQKDTSVSRMRATDFND